MKVEYYTFSTTLSGKYLQRNTQIKILSDVNVTIKTALAKIEVNWDDVTTLER